MMQCGEECVGSNFYKLLLPEATRLSAGRSAGHEHQAASNWVQLGQARDSLLG